MRALYALMVFGALTTQALAEDPQADSKPSRLPISGGNGGFTRVISLDVPSFRGLEPNLRLTYDSSSGLAVEVRLGGLLPAGHVPAGLGAQAGVGCVSGQARFHRVEAIGAVIDRDGGVAGAVGFGFEIAEGIIGPPFRGDPVTPRCPVVLPGFLAAQRRLPDAPAIIGDARAGEQRGGG